MTIKFHTWIVFLMWKKKNKLKKTGSGELTPTYTPCVVLPLTSTCILEHTLAHTHTHK